MCVCVWAGDSGDSMTGATCLGSILAHHFQLCDLEKVA